MAKKYAAEAVVRVTAETRSAQRDIRGLQRGFDRFSQFTRNMRGGLLGVNNMLMGQGAVMVGAGLAARSAVRNYERYSSAQARLRGILASTGTDLRRQNELMQSADVSARRFGFGLADSSEAMGTLLETGVESQEAMRYFGTAAEFARAADVEMNNASRVLVDSMRQFNMQSERGATTLAGAFTVAGRMSSTSIEELQQAFRYASVEMSGLGYNANETVSALAGMSAIGLRSTTAGTRLRGMLAALHTITNTTRERVEELGGSTEQLNGILYDEEGHLRPLIDATERLSTFFQTLPTHTARNEIAIRMFGRRALAAGIMLSRLHARGEDWIRVSRSLQDTEQTQEMLHRAAEERMRGFAAQMSLARVAAEEFGISFMQMLLGTSDASERGFGQYLRDMALAIRGADENAEMTGIMRQQYMELTDATREQGRQWRETFKGLADLLRVLGQVGLVIGRVAASAPRLTVGLLLLSSAARPLVALFGTNIVASLRASSAAMALLGTTTQATTRMIVGRLMVTVGWIAALGLAWHVARNYVNDYAREQLNMGREMDTARNSAQEFFRTHHMGILTEIPLLGTIIEDWGTLVNLMGQAIDANRTIEQQRRTSQLQQMRGAAERVAARTSRVRGSERRASEEYGYAEMRAANLEVRDEMQDLAAFVAARTDTEAEALQMAIDEMRAAGAAENELVAMRESLRSAIRAVDGNAEAEMQRLSRLGENARSSAEALRELQQYARMATATYQGGGGVTGDLGGITPAGDVAVQSTGFLPFPVSAGDMLVHRGELARAIAGAPGDLVGPAGAQQAGSMPQSQNPQSSNMTVDLTVDQPIMIDGREVARAVGRHTFQVDQRRGGQQEAASRRRVMENGAP